MKDKSKFVTQIYGTYEGNHWVQVAKTYGEKYTFIDIDICPYKSLRIINKLIKKSPKKRTKK